MGRESVAAVTPGHPNQSLCPVCEGGAEARRRLFMGRDYVRNNNSEQTVDRSVGS